MNNLKNKEKNVFINIIKTNWLPTYISPYMAQRGLEIIRRYREVYRLAIKSSPIYQITY